MVLDNFVVFEGIDGSGTSTQIRALRTRLAERPDIKSWFTWEPTDSPLGLLLRSVLREKIKLHPRTLAYLFAADRCEHLYAGNGILPHLEHNELVVSDRYILSSLVYQGLDIGDDIPQMLNSDFPLPSLMFLLDLPAEVAEERYAARESQDLYERVDFQKLLRTRYLELAVRFSERGTLLVLLDATKSIDDLAERVWREVQKLPIFQR